MNFMQKQLYQSTSNYRRDALLWPLPHSSVKSHVLMPSEVTHFMSGQHSESTVQLVCCSPHALTAIDADKATMTARKEKCIMVRSDESARIVTLKDGGTVGRLLALYLECSNGELRSSEEWLSVLNGTNLGRTLASRLTHDR
ncbi:hypothetical protein CY34DRAFT_806304 [Suillus luteus UH-Slu-Lm8-n1]|uniref:Uncharacterized protein n=1 Tax=Suillus luteus UH-Slu-Lm8-n1 TaxID=930992 RepID=A0A0D0BCX7_9AGAM|nr:hypothetical protein CY34DRAFT_806304 [Suillus luteus UH-Slu-Lm8-n1]